MNTTTLTAELPLPGRPRWSPRLVSAELLKLRKRRGLVISTLAVCVVPMLIVHAVFLSQDGLAGGMESFVTAMDLLGGMSLVAAILVGATVGTGDLGAGVFRELVVTGRSRLALFAVRVPAGLGVLLPIVGGAFAVTATVSTVFAGSQETRGVAEHGDFVLGNIAPSASLLLQSAGWLALATALSYALALGVSSLIGSRGISIGVLLGWFLVVMPLLLDPAFRLGSLRTGLFYAALERLRPEELFAGATPGVPMSLATAAAVLMAWTLVPLGIGAWRTCTRDA
jgi:hypothetical protein